MKRLYADPHETFRMGSGSSQYSAVLPRVIEPGTASFVIPYFFDDLPNLNIPPECRQAGSGAVATVVTEQAGEQTEAVLVQESNDVRRMLLTEDERSDLAAASRAWVHALMQALGYGDHTPEHPAVKGKTGEQRLSNERAYFIGNWANYMAEQGLPETNDSLVTDIDRLILEDVTPYDTQQTYDQADAHNGYEQTYYVAYVAGRA